MFKSKKNELWAILREALSHGLPPLFRVHGELIRRTDAGAFEMTCSLEELSQSLGYSAKELQTILKDLSVLDFIEYREGEDKSLRIKILVK